MGDQLGATPLKLTVPLQQQSSVHNSSARSGVCETLSPYRNVYWLDLVQVWCRPPQCSEVVNAVSPSCPEDTASFQSCLTSGSHSPSAGLFNVPWALGKGVWYRHSSYGWALHRCHELCINCHQLHKEISLKVCANLWVYKDFIKQRVWTLGGLQTANGNGMTVVLKD